MRNAEIKRKTAETDITLRLKLDGKGVYQVDTGCGFLNEGHALEEVLEVGYHTKNPLPMDGLNGKNEP